VVNENDINSIVAIAFLLPNKAITDAKVTDFIVSVDEIESLTGLDFLSKIPAFFQDEIESTKSPNLW
jgi:endonuclease G